MAIFWTSFSLFIHTGTIAEQAFRWGLNYIICTFNSGKCHSSRLVLALVWNSSNYCVFYQETPTHPGTWTASYSFSKVAGVLPELGLKLCSALIFIAAGMPVWIDQFITCLNCNYVWRVYEVLTILMYPCGKSPTVGDFSSPLSLSLPSFGTRYGSLNCFGKLSN